MGLINESESNVGVSTHGIMRVLERTHCKRSNVYAFLERVWYTGNDIDHYNRKSAIYKYLVNVARAGGEDRTLKVKGNVVFIFNKNGTTLVTCYEIPQKVLQDKRK